MRAYVIAYIATGIVFLALDAVWITTMAPRLYKPLIGDILLDGFRIGPAILFYLVYLGGIMVFVTSPAFASGKWSTATIYGALFGFFAYATYDLTSHAILKSWSTVITIADISWGVFLTATAGTIGFLIAKALASNN